MERRGWEFCRVDGSMPVAVRERCMAEFQSNPSIPIFLLISLVGGLGLTLHGVDRVVIMNPSWNPRWGPQGDSRCRVLIQLRTQKNPEKPKETPENPQTP